MQRDAVHGRGHAVLAHAVVDVGAGDSSSGLTTACSLTLVLLEPVRSAEPPIKAGQRRDKVLERRCRPVRVAILGGRDGELLSWPRRSPPQGWRGGRRSGSLEASRRLRIDACHALLPGLRRPRRACAACAPGREHVGGTSNGGHAPNRASRARRRSPRRPAARRGWRPCPALVGAPKPMTVLQAISVGLSERRAPLDGAGDRRRGRGRRSPAPCPAGGLEALDLVVGDRERGRPVDRDRVVVEQHDQLVELEVAGQRDRLLADALHQAAVAGEHVGEVVDDGVAEPRIDEPLGQRHAHRVGEALAQRARWSSRCRARGRTRGGPPSWSRAGGSCLSSSIVMPG